ncbi:hypothetical protein KJ742_07665 [Patescibacteria group bacterium]|nr:hypothetical protein [Patescibacteria group bacterium]MBU1683788.1 hypothetical protein [Patescibacteria group bacterium]MBU1935593.1 hypothetical protein [Patescibacteria group bacterium]
MSQTPPKTPPISQDPEVQPKTGTEAEQTARDARARLDQVITVLHRPSGFAAILRELISRYPDDNAGLADALILRAREKGIPCDLHRATNPHGK